MRVALPTVPTYSDYNDRVRYSSMNRPGLDELPLPGQHLITTDKCLLIPSEILNQYEITKYKE